MLDRRPTDTAAPCPARRGDRRRIAFAHGLADTRAGDRAGALAAVLVCAELLLEAMTGDAVAGADEIQAAAAATYDAVQRVGWIARLPI